MYSYRVEETRSNRVVELKREIALLQQDEKRLQWLLASKFPTGIFRRQAQRDLEVALEKLKALGDDLTRAEREIP